MISIQDLISKHDNLELNSLTAVSSVDGRYAEITKLLRPIFSEYGLIFRRLIIEIYWLQALSREPLIQELPMLSEEITNLLNNLLSSFSLEDAKKIKNIELTINHDVKAVEYFIKDALITAKFTDISEFVHFACTSEDINNLAYALMLREARDNLLLVEIKKIINELIKLTQKYAQQPMLSRTHGQVASPTTVGKEIANFAYRLQRQHTALATMTFLGKINGAVGNYNAHYITYPNIDWEDFTRRFVTEDLGLDWNPYTTQIEPHDYMAELFHVLIRINTILIDLCRDLWGYISLGYLNQNSQLSEVGSSTMPHKINPINFENAEGNLGIANAMLNHLASKLPISRWQRDLTDSTVLRTLGTVVSHMLIAYQACIKGLQKLEANITVINADLDNAWEILAEAIQTMMRRYQITQSYELLKSISYGKKLDANTIRYFINNLNIPEVAKQQLLALTPARYIGDAVALTQRLQNNITTACAAIPSQRPTHPR